MEVNNNRNNYLFYNPEAAKNAAKILNENWRENPKEELKKVWKAIEEAGFFSALSLDDLRASKHCNPALFDILHCKWLSHALNFEGQVWLKGEFWFSQKMIDLNGNYEMFTIPMLGTNLLKWASNKPLEQKKASAIGSILQNALFHENLDDKKIAKALHDLEQGIPIMVGGGWGKDSHSINVLLLQDNDEDYNDVIIGNRGDDSQSGGGISGWNVYKIRKIDAEFIKNIATVRDHQKSDYLSAEKLVKDYGAKLIYSYPMKEQKVGNCSYTSLKAGISALMKIYEKSEGFKLKVSEELFLKIEKGEKNDSYKSFIWADKAYVLEDFLIDLKQNEDAGHFKRVAEKIYEKLMSSPFIGFRIGWDLWLKTIELCQTTFLHLQPLNPHVASLVRQFISEDAENSLEKNLCIDRLIKLIFTLIDNKLNQKDQIKNCINLLITLVQKGSGFKESTEVILKLLNTGQFSLSTDLLFAIMRQVQPFEKELTLYKSLLMNVVDKVEKKIPSQHAPYIQRFIEELVTLNKGEILNQLMLDPELEHALKPIIQLVYMDFFNQEDRAEATKLLSSVLSKDVLESYDKKSLCEKAIKDNRIKEALEYFKNLEEERKKEITPKIVLACIKEKFWNEALDIIRGIEFRNLKLLLLAQLSDSLEEEELSDEVRKITCEIKKLEIKKL